MQANANRKPTKSPSFCQVPLAGTTHHNFATKIYYMALFANKQSMGTTKQIIFLSPFARVNIDPTESINSPTIHMHSMLCRQHFVCAMQIFWGELWIPLEPIQINKSITPLQCSCLCKKWWKGIFEKSLWGLTWQNFITTWSPLGTFWMKKTMDPLD